MSNIRRWRTSSYAVRSDLLRVVFAAISLVLGAGAEELLPKIIGVGVPILLTVLHFYALRSPIALTVIFAIAAGAIEDALSSLPPMTSVSFFLMVALVVRWMRIHLVATAMIYSFYQVWLAIWMIGMGSGAFSRIFIAIPLGAMTGCLIGWILDTATRKAAIDEQG